MQIYGLMYMGGKSQIAGDILELIPPAPAFIDLFGGGGAMSHAAYLSGKFGAVHYNELLPKTYGAFSRAVAGTLIPSVLRFIGRDDYDPDDPYCAFVWSISLDNQLETYAYPRVSEPLWRALWDLRAGNPSALESVGVFSDVSSTTALKRNRVEIIAQYRKYYITEVLGLPSDVDAGDLAQAYDRAIKERGETIRLFLRDCLAKAGKTQADVDRHLGTNGMAGHYFGASEWELPHAETYERMREIIPGLPPYEELLGSYWGSLEDVPIDQVRALQALYRYTEKLAPERAVVAVPRIQRAQALKGLNITCTNGDYRDVPIPAGAVVYADPPYYGTTQYDDKAPPFDTAGLLDYLARLPNAVYLSETSRIQDMASAHGFTLIWTKDRHRNMCAKAGAKVTECVYYKEARDG